MVTEGKLILFLEFIHKRRKRKGGRKRKDMEEDNNNEDALGANGIGVKVIEAYVNAIMKLWKLQVTVILYINIDTWKWRSGYSSGFSKKVYNELSRRNCIKRGCCVY
jgi:hypothetical protein